MIIHDNVITIQVDGIPLEVDQNSTLEDFLQLRYAPQPVDQPQNQDKNKDLIITLNNTVSQEDLSTLYRILYHQTIPCKIIIENPDENGELNKYNKMFHNLFLHNQRISEQNRINRLLH